MMDEPVLVNSLRNKQAQWSFDGLNTSQVVNDELLKYLCVLVEGEVRSRSENPKINVKFDKFNDSYNSDTSPFSKMRFFLDTRNCAGSLSDFKLFNIEEEDTDACGCKRSWDLGRSVFALSANYSVGRGKKLEVVSFFDLYYPYSSSKTKVALPRMTVFDYVEIPLDLVVRFPPRVKDNYLEQRVDFYKGRNSFNKNQRITKIS